jgi:outer membrane protein assembly factor BamB
MLVGSEMAKGADVAWPQFRGPNCSGRAEDGQPYPAEIGPQQNVLWRVPLPPGHSSVAIAGRHIFLTAVRDKTKLVTLALDRSTGQVLWEAEAPHEKLEAIHSIGSHAQPSPATDGRHVISFFGSAGMFCYDLGGRLIWHKRMGPFNNEFGAGTSPIIVEGRVILCQDHDTDSFLAAYEVETGKALWQTDRSEFPRNYCSPVILEVGGKKQIVIAATLRVCGYDFLDGKELWTVRGLSRSVCMTPVVDDEQVLYVAGWSAGADPGELIRVDPFDQVVGKLDLNRNGTLEKDEIQEGPFQPRFGQVDRDKTGSITRAEYEYYRGLFEKSRNVVMAIKPGAIGEATSTHVLWEHHRHVPFCASPLYYQGNLLTIKDGGILSCLNARTGAPLKQDRLEATGSYYASPVAGGGKVYLANERGKVTVIEAGPAARVLHTADFGEDIYATPALVEGKIYLRTTEHLYCLGMAGK